MSAQGLLDDGAQVWERLDLREGRNAVAVHAESGQLGLYPAQLLRVGE